MSFMTVLLAGILVLGPLIAIHEFGHFWVARRNGVQVLTFSIGFGPTLWRRVAADGVEYRLGIIPLGGYVRMLDEREGDVPDALRHKAFNRQPLLKRTAIVAAGPVINLLFAVLLFWLLIMQGEPGLRPIIGQVLPESPAAVAGLRAGDELVEVSGRSVNSWEGVTYALIDRAGESGELDVLVKSENNSQLTLHRLSITNYLSTTQDDPLHTLGIAPWSPPVPAVVGLVESGSRAEQAGLLSGDRVLRINEEDVSDWMQVVRAIVLAPGVSQQWLVDRQGETLSLSVQPEQLKDASGRAYGRLGVGVAPADVVIPEAYRQEAMSNPLTALWAALLKTAHLVEISLSSLGKMITGLIGVDALSGPITIVKVAGQSADIGWQAFISFMALLSVSLGVLNLLPIPVLDGGHLLFYAIEAVRGKPLSERIQQMGLQIGIAIIGSVMLLALLNDLRRLF